MGRRRGQRSAQNPEAIVGLPDLDDLLRELYGWANGMPWVVESPSDARETLNLFMLDCAPPFCHEPWFAINVIEEDSDDVPGIIVILPEAIADRASAIGFPTSRKEFQALQRLLEVTYVAAFEQSS